MNNPDFLTIINKFFVNAGRYFVAVASILTILASGLLIFAGIWEFINGIPGILDFLFHHEGHHVELSVHFISAIDLFMVAVVMFVMGIGLFELFVDRDQSISYSTLVKNTRSQRFKRKIDCCRCGGHCHYLFETHCYVGKTFRNIIFWWCNSTCYCCNYLLF